jgi:hypothetical protein
MALRRRMARFAPRWRPVQPRLVAYPADPSGHRAAGSSRVRKGHGAEQWMLFIACHSLGDAQQ